ncbi:GntR family transcriptional regulator [Microbacterium capsulatum]|uniref:GntR family transcriptional regulator n=1 Tax=Microbacterium capsulatum TaxID=3041921 RepID=A0ABU0XDC5_9MICO|nr:GntR family transcriptional regulator [Microbacterium sp. ASV81]MDQ4213119.1 GntR family transcriptional regulator [Microbacterium sp. ASV81]
MASNLGPGVRAAVFAQLADAGRAEQVAQRLADGIALGVLEAGERLPSEPELVRRFGVALITVREALGILRAAGVLETRRGRGGGSFVVGPGLDQDDLLAARVRRLSPMELADLALFFEALASAAAVAAAERATEDEVARVARWLDAADYSTATTARMNQGGFHLELAVLSQSPRLVREQIRLQAESGSVLLAGLEDQATRAEVGAADRRILRALQRRHPRAARAAVGALADVLLQRVLAQRIAVARDGLADAIASVPATIPGRVADGSAR